MILIMLVKTLYTRSPYSKVESIVEMVDSIELS